MKLRSSEDGYRNIFLKLQSHVFTWYIFYVFIQYIYMLYTAIFTLTHMNSLHKRKPKFVYHWTLEIMITASITISQQRMSNIIIYYLQYF